MNDDLLSYLNGFLTEERKQRFEAVLSFRTNYITVAMEDVFQLHNTSAVLRSCDAFGIQNLHVIENRFGKRLDKNIAMGAEKWVGVHRYNEIRNCLSSIRAKGYQIVATVPNDVGVPMDNFPLDKPAALFFGTERLGLSQEIITEADAFLYIPMVGFSESLNISVAAAIVLQNLTQRLRNSGFNWQLSEAEKQELRLSWTKNSIKSVDEIIDRFRKENE